MNKNQPQTEASILIAETCNEVRDLLLSKNAAYGNSALEPVRIFSRADREEQLRVRIDDKLSRLCRGKDVANEDTLLDLVGYMILLLAARRQHRVSFADEVAERMANIESWNMPPEATPQTAEAGGTDIANICLANGLLVAQGGLQDYDQRMRMYYNRELDTAQERSRGAAWQRRPGETA